MRLIVVIDERCVEGEEPDSALVGLFPDPEAANKAIKKVMKHWETFEDGAEADCHNLVHFDFDGEIGQFTMPVYEEAVGEEDDDEDEEEDEEDDDEDEEEDEEDDGEGDDED